MHGVAHRANELGCDQSTETCPRHKSPSACGARRHAAACTAEPAASAAVRRHFPVFPTRRMNASMHQSPRILQMHTSEIC